MPVSKGEMTRRLLKCYPGGNSPDKQPVPNELSMFTFYLASRPAKIHKASTMLSAKAHHYSSGDAGNFNVTALIMSEMMDKVNDHFPSLAEGALDIVDLTIDQIQGHDTASLELAKTLFTKFNKYHKGVLFMGHPTYAKKFLRVLEKFSDIASAGQPLMRIMASESLGSFSQSPALATHIGQKGLPAAIRGLKANIPQDASFYKEQYETTEDDESQIGHANKKNVGTVAVTCLKNFLDVNYVDQIISIVTSLLEWVSATPQRDWQRLFVSSLPKWTPPQSRFIVTQTAVGAIYGLPKEAVKEAIIYSGYIESLLTADESKIGSSVIDVLRKLMRVQQRLIASPPRSSDSSHIQELIMKLRKNIGELVEINTYPGQANDMLAEILRQYYVYNESFPSPSSGVASSRSSHTGEVRTTGIETRGLDTSLSGNQHPIGVIINDLKDVMEILESKSLQSQRKSNTEIWEGTQWSLTSSNPQILVLYTKCLQKFLELAQNPTSSLVEQGLVVRQSSETLSQKLAAANYIAGYYSLISCLDFLGTLNHYSLPWLYQLVKDNNEIKDTVASSGDGNGIAPETASVITESSNLFETVCRSSVGLASFLLVFRKQAKEESAQTVFAIINDRVAKSVWSPGITYPPTMPIEDAVSGVMSQGSIVFKNVPESGVPLDKLGLSQSEQDAIKNPPTSLAPSTVPLDNESTARKLRASTSSLHSGSRNFTTETFATVSGSIVPGIRELRRKETDMQNISSERSSKPTKSEKKISLPPKRDSVATMDTHQIDMLSLVQSISSKGSSPGNSTT